jgi:hypothetical protein
VVGGGAAGSPHRGGAFHAEKLDIRLCGGHVVHFRPIGVADAARHPAAGDLRVGAANKEAADFAALLLRRRMGRNCVGGRGQRRGRGEIEGEGDE